MEEAVGFHFATYVPTEVTPHPARDGWSFGA
jgi:hypothetical protein